MVVLSVAVFQAGLVRAQDADPVRPLLRYSEASPASVLPEDTLYLDPPAVIESYLAALDGHPPDWARLYGAGEDAHMDRLFEENRARDRLRAGSPALARSITFVWEGVMTGYDAEAGGFRLAVGPKVIPTAWGHVRFKPAGLPGGLVAVPPAGLREELRARRAGGETIEVDLILTGRLIPEESIIYDFAHEEEGQGMVMPVVRVERIDYFLAEQKTGQRSSSAQRKPTPVIRLSGSP